MDELIEHSKRLRNPRLVMHFDPRHPIGNGVTARAVSFGEPPSLAYLVPQGQIPVLSADGTEVTLQLEHGFACPECGITPNFDWLDSAANKAMATLIEKRKL